jgi:hypothetical protein
MLRVSSTDRVFILAGAGVSAESGIPTFRGVGGLWRNCRIEEVASPLAWHRDPRLATVLCSRQGGELACPNFLLVNQKVAPLTFIAEFRTPHAPVSEIEDHCRAKSAGRLDAPDCVISFRCHTALPFIASGEMRV